MTEKQKTLAHLDRAITGYTPMCRTVLPNKRHTPKHSLIAYGCLAVAIVMLVVALIRY